MLSMDHFDINIPSITAHLHVAYQDHLLQKSYISQKENTRRTIILGVVYVNLNETMFS